MIEDALSLASIPFLPHVLLLVAALIREYPTLELQDGAGRLYLSLGLNPRTPLSLGESWRDSDEGLVLTGAGVVNVMQHEVPATRGSK